MSRSRDTSEPGEQQPPSQPAEGAIDERFPELYDELRRLATRQLGRERSGHTLQPTALVHEVYLRLLGQRAVALESRGHFLSVAARTIRNVLVDHARRRESRERGEVLSIGAMDPEAALSPSNELDVLGLEEALGRLEELHPRQARVVELRFFGGLGLDGITGELGISARTVDGDWSIARAWLARELNRGAAP